MLLRGCGIKLDVEPFHKKFNAKAIAICPTAIIAGIALSIGFDRQVVEGATGDYHSNLNKKAEAAYETLYKKDYDFCFLHVKGYDETGHDKLVDMRISFVKRIDEMIGLFIQLCKEETDDCLIAITGDHSTPMYYGDHSFEPVQFTVGTKQSLVDDTPMFLSDDVKAFSEVDASLGVLGRFPGREVMKLVFKLRDRINQQGYTA